MPQPLSKEELKRRIDELWREELEWLRQNPEPDLSTFEAEYGKEVNRKSLGKRIVRELPALNIAMWSKDISFDLEIRDPEKYNNRFIELPTPPASSAPPCCLAPTTSSSS